MSHWYGRTCGIQNVNILYKCLIKISNITWSNRYEQGKVGTPQLWSSGKLLTLFTSSLLSPVQKLLNEPQYLKKNYSWLHIKTIQYLTTHVFWVPNENRYSWQCYNHARMFILSIQAYFEIWGYTLSINKTPSSKSLIRNNQCPPSNPWRVVSTTNFLPIQDLSTKHFYNSWLPFSLYFG